MFSYLVGDTATSESAWPKAVRHKAFTFFDITGPQRLQPDRMPATSAYKSSSKGAMSLKIFSGAATLGEDLELSCLSLIAQFGERAEVWIAVTTIALHSGRCFQRWIDSRLGGSRIAHRAPPTQKRRYGMVGRSSPRRLRRKLCPHVGERHSGKGRRAARPGSPPSTCGTTHLSAEPSTSRATAESAGR
jgi:hypothetical protein